MSSLKRITFISLFILFMLSIMDDLSKQTPEEMKVIPETEPSLVEPGIAHIKVEPGDTILSVTKEINELDELNSKQIIHDFKQLNPGVEADSLIPHSFYYFPLYNE